jgi:hypothetical protein
VRLDAGLFPSRQKGARRKVYAPSPVRWWTKGDPSFWGSGRDGLNGRLGHLLDDGGVDGLSPGENVESEVAAAFGPFVVLFSARTAPTRRMFEARFGKMPTTSVRRRISRFSRWGCWTRPGARSPWGTR